MNNEAPPEIKNEIEDAKQDLREALNDVEERVGEGIARVEDGIASLNPERNIKRRPIAAAGVVSIIGSIMMLLHQWMPWWQVFGIVGLGSILLAAILRRVLMPRDVPIFQIATPRDN